MDEYLAFVDYIGKSNDDMYVYRFDFTNYTDTVWGDYFNVAPTIIIPDLQPEDNTICKSARVKIDKELNLAKKNGCFSMQDCFDGIISLAFTELTEEDTIYYNDEPLYFDFGEPFDVVEEKLNKCGYKFFEITDKEIGDETIIDDLIESIENIEDEEKTVIEEDDKGFTLSLSDEYQEIFRLKIGDKIKHNYINETLFNNGYKRVDYVFDEGQYTLRGHIIDIYSYKNAYPVRISFFGDEIEEIYKFDEFEQKKIESIDEIIVYGTNKEKDE